MLVSVLSRSLSLRGVLRSFCCLQFFHSFRLALSRKPNLAIQISNLLRALFLARNRRSKSPAAAPQQPRRNNPRRK